MCSLFHQVRRAVPIGRHSSLPRNFQSKESLIRIRPMKYFENLRPKLPRGGGGLQGALRNLGGSLKLKRRKKNHDFHLTRTRFIVGRVKLAFQNALIFKSREQRVIFYFPRWRTVDQRLIRVRSRNRLLSECRV